MFHVLCIHFQDPYGYCRIRSEVIDDAAEAAARARRLVSVPDKAQHVNQVRVYRGGECVGDYWGDSRPLTEFKAKKRGQR